MPNGEVTTNEIMEFLKEHMVTKEELGLTNSAVDQLAIRVIGIEQRLGTFATKDDLTAMKTEIITTVDRFAKLHEVLDQELVSMRHRQDRLEERLGTVERKLGFAA